MYLTLYFRQMKYSIGFMGHDSVVSAAHNIVQTREIENNRCLEEEKRRLMKEYQHVMWSQGKPLGYLIKTEEFPGQKGHYFKQDVE